ncbi:MAG: hypothetical protein ACRDQU_10840 [Pseudonocardiaceae bacterium]
MILTRGGRPVANVHAIDADQAWFWTPEWQARERESTRTGPPASRTESSILARILSPTWKSSLTIHLNCEPNAPLPDQLAAGDQVIDHAVVQD